MNKFWGESNSSSDSSSEDSDEEPQVQAKQEQGRRPMARWAEESSSDDEVQQRRVVRSKNDTRYAQLLERIGQIKNHQKIDDFTKLITDYEAITKMLEKLKNVVEQDGGPPAQFIKAISQLEKYADDMHSSNQEKKASTGERMTEARQRAFNTLRAKVRKGNKMWAEQIEHYQEHPSEFESEAASEKEDSDASASSDDAGGADSDSDSSSSSDSDSSSSDSDSSSDSSDSDSESDSSSSSSSSGDSDADSDSWRTGGSSSDDEDLDEEAAREKKMLRWVILPEKEAEREEKRNLKKGASEPEKGKKTKRPTQTKPKKTDRGDDKDKGKEPEEYTAEELVKKITEISQQRGRRGFDRQQYMTKLTGLMVHAEKQGPQACLFIYSAMVSADFDGAGGAFAQMSIDRWNEALDKIGSMLPLLADSHKEWKEGNQSVPDTEDAAEYSHPRQQELFVYNVEKLDDELYKALQFTTDVYGSEYQEILGNCTKFLKLLNRVLKFFEDTKQVQPLGTIALRLMEQLYYKPDVLNAAIYESISHGVADEDKHLWVWPEQSRHFLARLCRHVYATGIERNKRRAALCQAYHLALHDHFQAARDLLHLGNIMEAAHESQDVHTQILYNRAIAQMGLCAFRLGKIQEGHNCLADVCMHNKARELLAQGLSYSKNMDRTAEQERAERLRQLPYHMHINLEVLESAHHICAMLLEVPNLAMQAIDPTNKRIISRVLRRALESYDKQLFTGPPENAKEAVVSAAKALQRGDWQSACSSLEDLKLWDHIDPGKPENGKRVKEMIKEKIKVEALRTYLFAYASIYDAFHLDQLVGMFDLDAKLVHSIVSKMMIKEEITAFWDESSKFVLMQHVEPTPLQRFALALADRGAQAVENNERLVDAKTGGHGIKEQRPQQGGGRWDQQGGPGDRRRMGKGGVPGPISDSKGKGKSRGKMTTGPPRNRGWDNARAGAIRGNAQRGWSQKPVA